MEIKYGTSLELPNTKKPIICARKRVSQVRNRVDHVAVTFNNGTAAFAATDEAVSVLRAEREEAEQHKVRKGWAEYSVNNTTDHVQRIIDGEKKRLMAAGTASTGDAAARNSGRYNAAAGGSGRAPNAAAASFFDETESPMHTYAQSPSTPPNALATTQRPRPFSAGAAAVTFLDTKAFAESTTSSRADEMAGRGASSSGTRTQHSSPAELQSPAPRPAPARPHISIGGEKEGNSAAVRAALEAERLANGREVVAYYGDTGVGAGTTTRRKAVPPPRESYAHPITGEMLPSARAASASRMFDRSGMDAAVRAAIAAGDYTVPEERRRSSIAVGRAASAPRSGPPMTHAQELRAMHRSNAFHTAYLFGSAAGTTQGVPPPRRGQHVLDEATLDKEPTEAQRGRDRRASYAIELVQPRHIPTNVSSFAIKDEVPTHEGLLRERAERPASRKGALASLYNDTTGFFDPAVPFTVKGRKPLTPRRARSESVGAEPTALQPPQPQPQPQQLQQQKAPVVYRASSVEPQPQPEPRRSQSAPHVRYAQLTALERRSPEYQAVGPAVGRRTNSPSVDTFRVLCPDRLPPQAKAGGARPPSPSRLRCQVPAVMAQTLQSSSSARPSTSAEGGLRAASVDRPRPQGILTRIPAFVPPSMTLRPAVVTGTTQSHLWCSAFGNGAVGGNSAISSVLPRPESPRGRRRVDSPASRATLTIA